MRGSRRVALAAVAVAVAVGLAAPVSAAAPDKGAASLSSGAREGRGLHRRADRAGWAVVRGRRPQVTQGTRCRQDVSRCGATRGAGRSAPPCWSWTPVVPWARRVWRLYARPLPTFLKDAPADVAVGLVSFAGTAGVDVPPTKDRGRVQKAVNSLRSRGETTLYDGVAVAASALSGYGERSIVLLSDGETHAAPRRPRPALQQC